MKMAKTIELCKMHSFSISPMHYHVKHRCSNFA